MKIIQLDEEKCKGCESQKGIALGGLNLVSIKSLAVKKRFRNCGTSKVSRLSNCLVDSRVSESNTQ